MSMHHLLFVYGTLQRGFGLHRYLRGTRFVGSALTMGKFDMVNHGVPMIFADGSHKVKGEVFEITDAILPGLDRIEGGYERKTIPVAVNGTVLDCFAYIGPARSRPPHDYWFVKPNADGVLVYQQPEGW